MKKLLIATSVVAASIATIAFAGQTSSAKTTGFGFNKPFIAVTAGMNTNDQYAGDHFAKGLNSLIQNRIPTAKNVVSASDTKHAFIGGIQVGANLFNINNQVALGAELDADRDLAHKANDKFTANLGSGNSADLKIQATRYSIDPMVFVSYSPISKLTVKGKAGYGYQHVSLDADANIDGSSDLGNIDFDNIHKWEPVLAAEASYDVFNGVSVLAGDRYTFGKNWNSDKVNIFSNDSMPRQNVVYVGAKYTF